MTSPVNIFIIASFSEEPTAGGHYSILIIVLFIINNTIIDPATIILSGLIMPVLHLLLFFLYIINPDILINPDNKIKK